MATIVKRKDKYHVVYDYIDDYGVRKQKWTAFTNKKDANKFKLDIENKKLFGDFIAPTPKTVQDFMDEWVEVYSKAHWQFSQYTTVKGMLRNHVYPILGTMNVQDVTPLHIERLYNILSRKRKYRGKENEFLSSTTIKYIHSTLKVAFKKAEEWLIIDRSPVRCAAPKVAKSNITIWSDKIFKLVLQNMKDKKLHLIVHLAFMCSLRPGETLALTWDCVDFENNSISINKTLQRVYKDALDKLSNDTLIHVFGSVDPDAKSTLILKTPKTRASVRKIFISKPLKDELFERKLEIERVKHILGNEYKDNNLVFSLDNGLPIEIKTCAKRFKRWQQRCGLGLPLITLHGIRHSSSTYKLRISGGDTKSVQGDTGHTKADTLINTYSHIEDIQCINLTNTIEKDFYGEPECVDKTSEIDIIKLIKNDPELRKKALTALLAQIT